jgi:hypothetical protein
MNVFMVPARVVLGMYLLIDNLLPYLITVGTATGGVAYGAHIGGFVAGLAAAWAMGRREVKAVPDDYRDVRETPPATPSDEIAGALAAGRGDQAAQWYFALPSERSRRLLAPRTSLELARWLAESRHGEAALVVYQRHLRDFPEGPGLAEAHLGAGLVQLHLLNQPAAAYQHLIDALSLDPDPTTEQAARRAIAHIAALQKRQVPRATHPF